METNVQPSTIEERLRTLERQVAQLRAAMARSGRPKDWRRTVGMFTGDTVMQRIDEYAHKFREADRAKARGRATKAKR
jgi:hypothetical protein